MAKKPIDLDRVRRANARLAQLIKAHPELTGEASKEEWLNIIEEVLMAQDVYTIKEAADLFKVYPETLRRAIKDGKLKAARVGQDFQISKQDLREFYRAHDAGESSGDE